MPFISKAQELRRTNGALCATMNAFLEKQQSEKRRLTPEEDAEWNRMDEEYVSRQAIPFGVVTN